MSSSQTDMEGMIRASEWTIILYLPLVASRGDTSGGQAIAFTPTAVRQPLAVFHHTTLSLLWVEGHLLNGEVLVLLLCLPLYSKPTVKHSNK